MLDRLLTRRRLLAAGGSTSAALAMGLGACESDRPPAAAFDPRSWSSIRAQFELSDGVANFTTFVFASHPAPVRAAINQHRIGLDADPYGYLSSHEARLERAVATAAAACLRTTPEQIAFTDSTTMGLGLLYSGLAVAAGDEVLTTEHDFYSTHETLRLRQHRDGVTVRRVRLYDEPESAATDLIVHRLRAAISPRTRIIAITWVHSGTGVKLPIRAIADMVAQVNHTRPEAARMLLCVDGVHGFGVEDASPDELGCDFLVSGCHKWLFGPRGTGFVWGRAEAWQRFSPMMVSFTAGERSGPGAVATPGGYHSFEHRWALADAFEFHRAIGAHAIAQRTHALAGALKAGLSAIAKVRVRTPSAPELSSGIVCADVDGYSAGAAVARLRALNVLTSATPYDQSALRFGASILTSEADVTAALAAVRTL